MTRKATVVDSPRRRAVRAALPDTRRVDGLPVQLGLGWALGIDALSKWKAVQGRRRDHVIGMLRNRRVYLAVPHQFNGADDVAPGVRLAGDPNGPGFFGRYKRRSAQK